MITISDVMTRGHRSCDELFTDTENAVHDEDWSLAELEPRGFDSWNGENKAGDIPVSFADVNLIKVDCTEGHRKIGDEFLPAFLLPVLQEAVPLQTGRFLKPPTILFPTILLAQADSLPLPRSTL